MSAFMGRRGRLIGGLAGALIAAMACMASAQAETVTVHVDSASLLKLPQGVATIVIGNPLIADATLQGNGMLVVTGKGYGATTLMALDRSGQVVMNKVVQVVAPAGDSLVVVYKGIARETYSCAPECQPRMTLGDGNEYYNTTLSQIGARNGMAQGGAGGGGGGGGGGAPR